MFLSTKISELFEPLLKKMRGGNKIVVDLEDLEPEPKHHYRILSSRKDELLLDDLFDELRQSLYDKLEATRPTSLEANGAVGLFKERGKLESGQPYFFLQPKDDIGWLFERSGAGWVISRSEKIASQNQFLRDDTPWDIVVVYEPKLKGSSPRVMSQRVGNGVVSFPVYERMMLSLFL